MIGDLFRFTTETVVDPEGEGMEPVEAEKVWWCNYTEFQDPACHTEHENARPELTRQPHKHSACRWVLIAKVPE